MSVKIRKGDLVEIISGNDSPRKGERGYRGRVLEVYPKEGKVLVEGYAMIKKHLRQVQNRAGQVQGGITEREAPINISRIAFIDPKTDRPTRVGFSKNEKGEKIRVARTKKTGTLLQG